MVGVAVVFRAAGGRVNQHEAQRCSMNVFYVWSDRTFVFWGLLGRHDGQISIFYYWVGRKPSYLNLALKTVLCAGSSSVCLNSRTKI